MARRINILSALELSKKDQPGYYLDGGGLHLQVSKSRTKSWIFKYTLDGRTREMGFGPLITVSLAEAREMARDARKLLLDGKDPLAEREARKASRQFENAKRITFDECARQYIAAKRAGWKNVKHAEQWENSLATYCSPTIGKLYASDIDTGLVLKCIEPIWTEKTETATRVRGRVEKILDWAATRGYRKGENPARWKGHLEHNLAKPSDVAKVEHQPALPYTQIHDFMKALRQREGLAPLALELCILTAVRSGEVRGAMWGEIDFDNAVWTIPAERMKMENEHRVPLSTRALEILKYQLEAFDDPEPDEVVFPNVRGKGFSDSTLSAVIKRMNANKTTGPIWVDPKYGRRPVVPHGFRSTMRDWAAECTTHDWKICEKALAHLVGDETERAYQRGDLLEKRRELMEDWARYCDTPLGGNNVVGIKSKAAA